MAVISKIQLPNGSVYDIQDKTSGYIKSQDISGKANKSGDTFTGAITIPVTSRYNIPDNTVIRPASENLNASAMAGTMIWHDLFSFCRVSTPVYYTSSDGTTWTEATLEKSFFAQKGDNSKPLLTDSVYGARWVWGTETTALAWSSAVWLVIGVTYQEKIANYTVKFESSADNETWIVRHESTGKNATAPVYFKLQGYSGDRYLRLTISKEATDDGILNIGQIRLLTPRYGSQGKGIELEYPYEWDANANIYPIANNAKYLGTSTRYWSHIYGTNIHGTLDGKASSADKLNTNAGSATQPIYFENGVPKATSYTLNKSVPSDAKFTDTTYQSLQAASGGTDVSLVTTGEKYLWNSAASGGVTDVTINGASIVDGGVAAVPIAGTDELGVIREGNGFSVTKSGTYAGMLNATTYTAERAQSLNNNVFIGKGTLNNILANPSTMPALTATEQAAARARLGISDSSAVSSVNGRTGDVTVIQGLGSSRPTGIYTGETWYKIV